MKESSTILSASPTRWRGKAIGVEGSDVTNPSGHNQVGESWRPPGQEGGLAAARARDRPRGEDGKEAEAPTGG